MGNSDSAPEVPLPDTAATIYYFSGRGAADQIRWLLAVTGTTFKQKSIKSREKFLKMAERQLTFQQLPLIQIDGVELVNNQAIVRYLAKRGNLAGKSSIEEVKCDMIVGAVHELMALAYAAPFKRASSKQGEGDQHKKSMRFKWFEIASRLESIVEANGGKHLVGTDLTYADVLTAHCITWYVEEIGPDIVENTPLLVELQNMVISLPAMQDFIKSSLYFPLSGTDYVVEVLKVLNLPEDSVTY